MAKDNIRKTLDELKEEHGRVAGVELPDHGLLAFKHPKGEDWARYIDALSSSKGSNMTAAKILLMSCRVYPDAETAATALREYPGAILPIADAIGELGGNEFEVEIAKK